MARTKKNQRNESEAARCLRLKQQGYTDEELLGCGFDRRVIQRTVVTSASQSKRCRECGALAYIISQDRICIACQIRWRIANEC